MIFSSIFFLFVFLPITLIVYYLVPFKLKNLVLLLCSLVFYAWGEPIYVVLMILSIAINYVSGLEIAYYRETKEEEKARLAMIVTVVLNLAILGFYKYYGFLLSNINAILPFHIPYKELALPIGISFYTFQTLSYVIDVYLGKVEAQHNIISFGTYVTMFPQLIAGPIVRYSDIELQLKNRKISIDRFGEGTAWFLCGLAKKVLLANNIGAFFDGIIALSPAQTSVVTAWIGAFAYTMQIYFDFGGYSDMAIGLGKMLGFDFMKNFDYPYVSKSATEFWRRWHISLGSWFREYVYIPLGGNRVGAMKHIRNLLIVWALTGLWHGAAWNFIFWGLYYGLILIFEKYAGNRFLAKLPGFLQHIYALFLVMLGWILFAAPSLGRAFSYWGTMFGVGAHGFFDATAVYYIKSSWILGILCILCCTPLLKHRFDRLQYSKYRWKNAVYAATYGILFVLCIAYLVTATYNPFLYFRF
ncbi:MAG: MBOAT family protein [Blautia sp.]|nr:MBOAT family protein [Blautia sp.]